MTYFFFGNTKKVGYFTKNISIFTKNTRLFLKICKIKKKYINFRVNILKMFKKVIKTSIFFLADLYTEGDQDNGAIFKNSKMRSRKPCTPGRNAIEEKSPAIRK